ncbi:BRE1 [Candida oxycetoniae]|uniref:E3 ubiquitin protein ligase n=1 Tax=Candida oxycetoniae TaxID=497107 RepID=A0AAI9SXV9_9ASCO|nr:BRE1 [Candida oxycetoniae]KAI3404874.2 BRE1 [Candida oxycetoniae]
MNKRPSDSVGTTSAKKSKVALDELSTEGPLSQADVVYFKKEAIWRQMILYKQQVLKLKGEVKRLTRDVDQSKHISSVLIAWYEQLVALFDVEEGKDDNILVAFNDKVDAKLQTISKQLSKAISSKVAPSDIQSVQQLGTLKSENQILVKENQTLTENIAALESEILALINTYERNESKTLKRVDDARKEIMEQKEEEGKEGESTTTPALPAAAPAAAPQQQTNGSSLDTLTTEVEQLRTSNAILNEQTQALSTSNQELLKKTTALESKLHNLSESDLQDNPIYKRLIKNNQSLQEQISKVNKLNSVNVTKLSELEEKQNEIKKIVEMELVKENESLKQQLEKAEQDLVRVRTTRDELLAKNSLLTSEKEDQKSTESLLELNEIFSKRIEELTKEKFSPMETEHADSLLLLNEIREIESAFKQTRDLTIKKLHTTIDHENQVKKLTIEKNKADQKYFATMRLKDSLTNENKVLKQQVAKSQDLIKNLNELEVTYLNKIDILSKSLLDYKIIKENSLQENFALQDKVKSLQVTKEALEKDVERKDAKVNTLTSELSQSKDLANKQLLELTKLNKSLASTESLLLKYKANNTSSILEEDEQQIQALRSIAKCSVCTKNWKDTAITVCGHVFCSGCTHERLAARLRRCPTCNKGFSSNDLLTVHL